MKLTESKLKKIIMEEIEKALLKEYEEVIVKRGEKLFIVNDEGESSYYGPVYGSQYEGMPDGPVGTTSYGDYGGSRGYDDYGGYGYRGRGYGRRRY